MLGTYVRTLCDALGASFAQHHHPGFAATVYASDGPLIVAEVLLGEEASTKTPEVKHASAKLNAALAKVDGILLDKGAAGVFVRRDVRVYDRRRCYVVKRNQRRLWRQSDALRDADEIYGEIMRSWGQSDEPG